MDKIKNNSITNYQLFRREFIEPKNSYLEWAFTYILKCFYFPKYFRPEYLKWTERKDNKELYEKLMKGKFKPSEEFVFSSEEAEKEWDEKISGKEHDFLKGNISKGFIKYTLSFAPYEDQSFNIPTDEQVEQLYQAFQLVPKEWKEKQPWYPYFDCDLALDDCLITIKWTNKTKISEEEVEELMINYFDYDFPMIKKLGLYFPQQGKLLIANIWGECSSDITFKHFKEVINPKEKKSGIYNHFPRKEPIVSRNNHQKKYHAKSK